MALASPNSNLHLSAQLDCVVTPSSRYWTKPPAEARAHLVYSSGILQSCVSAAQCLTTAGSHISSRICWCFNGTVSLLPATLSWPLEVSGHFQGRSVGTGSALSSASQPPSRRASDMRCRAHTPSRHVPGASRGRMAIAWTAQQSSCSEAAHRHHTPAA